MARSKPQRRSLDPAPQSCFPGMTLTLLLLRLGGKYFLATFDDGLRLWRPAYNSESADYFSCIPLQANKLIHPLTLFLRASRIHLSTAHNFHFYRQRNVERRGDAPEPRRVGHVVRKRGMLWQQCFRNFFASVVTINRCPARVALLIIGCGNLMFELTFEHLRVNNKGPNIDDGALRLKESTQHQPSDLLKTLMMQFR